MLNKMQLRLSNIKAFPAIAIIVILALTLCLLGIYVIIPPELLGVAGNTTYPSIIVRSIFGMFMAYPAVVILYANVRYNLKTLIKERMPKLRPYIFWMGVTYAYLTILRILIAGLFPPIFLAYMALAIISFIVWLSNRYI